MTATSFPWARKKCSLTHLDLTLGEKPILVYTTQVNSTFRACWLASSEVISKVLLTSEQPKKNKMAFVGTLSQVNSLFWPLVIPLVWYILKQLITSVSVKVVDIYRAAKRQGKYPPLFTSTSVNKIMNQAWWTKLVTCHYIDQKNIPVYDVNLSSRKYANRKQS